MKEKVRNHLSRVSIPVTVTKPRTFTRTETTGERVTVIDSVQVHPGDEDGHFDTIVKAVSRFLPILQVLKNTRVKKGKLFVYTGVMVDAIAKDVLGACLVLHHKIGIEIGDELVKPLVSVIVYSHKYRISLKGKPLQSCQFCKRYHEPMKFGMKTQDWYHSACHLAAIEKKREELQKLQQGNVEV